MSIHINAKKGEIAETVLLPGDPLRAKFIAEKFLTEVSCYNTVRNMLGFTGRTKSGKIVSVQGAGMGMPSLSIYVNELIDIYGVKRIIRVGSCGSLQAEIECRDIIIAMGSCSDSALNKHRFHGLDFAPLADWKLLEEAHGIAKKLRIKIRVGNIFSTDKFYDDTELCPWKMFAKYGVLGIEMETAELYTLGAQKGVQALSILTVSDNLVIRKSLSAQDRETSFTSMMKIALALTI